MAVPLAGPQGIVADFGLDTLRLRRSAVGPGVEILEESINALTSGEQSARILPLRNVRLLRGYSDLDHDRF